MHLMDDKITLKDPENQRLEIGARKK